MELLYNPDVMPEQEIKATFVARQSLVDELVSLVEHQPDGAGVQHVVIVAPRGMGKTTVLLMVKFAIKDHGLANRWQAVKFPEESYGIYDLADFWLETLHLLAVDTNDVSLRQQAEDLKRKYPNNDDLQEAALAALKDWRRKHQKRLLLLVENFDLLLEQINDERDNARLRDALMNDGTIMLIGGATTFFKEARAYDQPLYNFFKLYDLGDLRFDQMQELLLRRAEVDGVPNFEETLQANASRLRVLEYFTGGNPRLVLMLYRVVVQSNLDEVRRGLEQLLDQVTPYYKAKVETLPPQQRKILDHIARVSSKTNEGVTPTEIAAAVRLTPNQVSAQLKRLTEIGCVRAANLRGRSSYYALSEPLYAIWHQMRFGRDTRQRMQWLVDFLRVWYADEEMGIESERLHARFLEHLKADRVREARDTLEFHRYLTEAMDDHPLRTAAKESVIHDHLALGETEQVKELLNEVKLEDLSEETLSQLGERGYISQEDLHSVKARKTVLQLAELAKTAYFSGDIEEALRHLDRLLEIDSDDATAWYNRGLTLDALGRYEEASVSYERYLAINPNDWGAWNNRGCALSFLDRYEEALICYERALALNPANDTAWSNRGYSLFMLDRFEEAVKSCDQALALKPDQTETWFKRGLIFVRKFLALMQQRRNDEARQSWTEALESGKRSGHKRWPDTASEALLLVAQAGQLSFARQLIEESGMEEQLFPLARAIDYVLSGDETLIEKLSPEVKGIVEEIISKLQPVAKKMKVRVRKRA